MNSKGFWEIFHRAWSNDRREGSNRPKDYNKQAWIYVQSRLEEYVREQEKEQKNN